MRKVLYILGELDDVDLQWVVDAGSLESVPSGTELVAERAEPDNLFIVVGGEFAVTHGGEELERRGPGELIGVTSFVDRRRTDTSVTALEESQVYSLSRKRLRTKIREDANFAKRFYRALCLLLVHRLSQSHALVRDEGTTDMSSVMGDEMSMDTLELVSRAGVRFEWFLMQVQEE